MNILILVPGGVDKSEKRRTIPALLALFNQLRLKHRLVIIATSQDREFQEYYLKGCLVLSLPIKRHHRLFFLKQQVEKRLAAHNFSPHVVHSFWLGLPALLGGLLSRRYQIPLMASIGGGELVDIPEAGYGGGRKIKRKIINRIGLKLASHVTIGSHYLKDMVEAEVRRYTPLSVVPLGIDTQFWTLRPPAKPCSGSWNLFYLASINRIKNPDLLLAIVKRLKEKGFNFHLDWVGIDTLIGSVQDRAKALNIDELITFHGHKEQDQVKQMMKAQQFILQTSLYESQGIALAEAASQGLCPVGTKVGWLSDMGMGHLIECPDIANRVAGDILELAEQHDDMKETVYRLQKWVRQNDSRQCAKKFTALYHRL